jgi:hypothetical protein
MQKPNQVGRGLADQGVTLPNLGAYLSVSGPNLLEEAEQRLLQAVRRSLTKLCV